MYGLIILITTWMRSFPWPLNSKRQKDLGEYGPGYMGELIVPFFAVDEISMKSQLVAEK